MNGREAILAMLDGKVVRITGKPRLYRYGEGFESKHLTSAAWTPDAVHILNCDTYELYEEPNPYPQGSYAWAKVEHARGHAVTNDLVDGGPYRHTLPWEHALMFAAEFETMTWRRA